MLRLLPLILAAAVSTPETYYVGSWTCRGEGNVTLNLRLSADGAGKLTGPDFGGGFRYRQDEKDPTELLLRFWTLAVELSVEDLTPGAPDTGYPPRAETMDVRLGGLPLACSRVRTGV